jgi:hypothetical protein
MHVQFGVLHVRFGQVLCDDDDDDDDGDGNGNGDVVVAVAVAVVAACAGTVAVGSLKEHAHCIADEPYLSHVSTEA